MSETTKKATLNPMLHARDMIKKLNGQPKNVSVKQRYIGKQPYAPSVAPRGRQEVGATRQLWEASQVSPTQDAGAPPGFKGELTLPLRVSFYKSPQKT